MGLESNRRGMGSTATFRIAGVGLLACTAYLIGTQGVLESTVQADATSSGMGVVVINDITPPVLVLEKNQRAIVGASDGLYYLVDFEGNSAVVKGERRTDLEWHRGGVPPASR